jgi:nicotinamidase-related amidase
MGDDSFRQALTRQAKKNIIVCGIEAHICVLQTVMDLLTAKYNVYIAADCVSSRYADDMAYALRRMENARAVITTGESVLFEIMKDARHPARKAVSALIK